MHVLNPWTCKCPQIVSTGPHSFILNPMICFFNNLLLFWIPQHLRNSATCKALSLKSSINLKWATISLSLQLILYWVPQHLQVFQSSTNNQEQCLCVGKSKEDTSEKLWNYIALSLRVVSASWRYYLCSTGLTVHPPGFRCHVSPKCALK